MAILVSSAGLILVYISVAKSKRPAYLIYTSCPTTQGILYSSAHQVLLLSVKYPDVYVIMKCTHSNSLIVISDQVKKLMRIFIWSSGTEYLNGGGGSSQNHIIAFPLLLKGDIIGFISGVQIEGSRCFNQQPVIRKILI